MLVAEALNVLPARACICFALALTGTGLAALQVIKIGTSSLIVEDLKSLHLVNLGKICEAVRRLKDLGALSSVRRRLHDGRVTCHRPSFPVHSHVAPCRRRI